jgi:hypothetical protein
MSFCAYKGLINSRHVCINTGRLQTPQSPHIRPYKCKEIQNRRMNCVTLIVGNKFTKNYRILFVFCLDRIILTTVLVRVLNIAVYCDVTMLTLKRLSVVEDFPSVTLKKVAANFCVASVRKY